MILPDANILVYAHDDTSPFHAKSRAWWEATLNSRVPVGLTWQVILGFIRLLSSPRIMSNPVTVEHACSFVDEWLNRSNVTILDPGPQHWNILLQTLAQSKSGPKLIADAHLAAIAKEYRGNIATNDRDFERFSGILVSYPAI